MMYAIIQRGCFVFCFALKNSQIFQADGSVPSLHYDMKSCSLL